MEKARRQELILARALMRLGNSPEALARLLRLYVEVLETVEQPTDQAKIEARNNWRSDLLREISWWLLLTGQVSDARTLMERAAEGDPEPIGTLQRLAHAQLLLGDVAGARESLKTAYSHGPSPPQEANLVASLCRADFDQGRLADARGHCLLALQELRQTDQLGTQPSVELILAQIERQDHRLQPAEEYARRACEAIEKQRLRSWWRPGEAGFSCGADRRPRAVDRAAACAE